MRASWETMTVGVTVRGVRPDEHSALASLTLSAYEALLGDDMDDGYRVELADVTARAAVSVVLVAVDAGEQLLGGVTYLPGPGPLAPFDDPCEAAIRYLAVAPEAQDRGVGATLITACVERARSEGKARISLHTTAPMTTAQRLYQRAGFRRDPDHDWEIEPGLLLLAYVLDLGR